MNSASCLLLGQLRSICSNTSAFGDHGFCGSIQDVTRTDELVEARATLAAIHIAETNQLPSARTSKIGPPKSSARTALAAAGQDQAGPQTTAFSPRNNIGKWRR